MQFSEKLRYYRKAHHLTQQKIAENLGIDRSTYSFYELGKAHPKFEVLKAIAKLYRISVDELLDESETEQLVSAPKTADMPKTEDKFNELSEFEKAVVFKTRLMSAAQKNKLLEYLSDSEE